MDYPKFPQCSGLTGRTLLRLLEQKKITHRDFQIISASYRLSAWIFNLREKGWQIDDRWEKVVTSDPTGRMARYKRYWLAPDLVNLMKRDKVFRTRVENFKKSVKSCERKKTPVT